MDIPNATWSSIEQPTAYFTSIRAETGDWYNYTIMGLIPGVPYTARVSANNNRGYGPTAASVPFSERPRTAPVSIAYGAVTMAQRLPDGNVMVGDSVSSLTVAWLPPIDARGNNVTSYLVEWATQPFTSARQQRQVIDLF